MYYQMYQDPGRQWRWRLRAANHYIISISSEGYNNEADCLHAINLNKASYNAPVHKV